MNREQLMEKVLAELRAMCEDLKQWSKDSEKAVDLDSAISRIDEALNYEQPNQRTG